MKWDDYNPLNQYWTCFPLRLLHCFCWAICSQVSAPKGYNLADRVEFISKDWKWTSSFHFVLIATFSYSGEKYKWARNSIIFICSKWHSSLNNQSNEWTFGERQMTCCITKGNFSLATFCPNFQIETTETKPGSRVCRVPVLNSKW